MSDIILGPVVVALRIIPCCYDDCTPYLSLPWESKVKYACNQKIYGIIYDCKYSIIFLSKNTRIIIKFLDDRTNKE